MFQSSHIVSHFTLLTVHLHTSPSSSLRLPVQVAVKVRGPGLPEDLPAGAIKGLKDGLCRWVAVCATRGHQRSPGNEMPFLAMRTRNKTANI
eukprot:scaffold44521_cov18-Tisochrysis_lutea.AAC.1